MRVAHQGMDLLPDSHVPDPGRAVPPSRDQHAQTLVDLHAVDPTQMSVVVPDNFVHLQIPALYRFVLPAGKEVGMLL